MNEQKQIDYSQKGYTKPKEHYIYRVKFTKGEEGKFIGHLDIMRLFQRAIKRAKLPVAYSQGFNPHQLLSFANPLTLGTTSEGEYGDFEMAEKIEPAFVVNELNKTLPKGVKVLDSVLITQKVQSAMASIDGAKYIVYTDKKLTEELKPFPCIGADPKHRPASSHLQPLMRPVRMSILPVNLCHNSNDRPIAGGGTAGGINGIMLCCIQQKPNHVCLVGIQSQGTG